MWPAHTYPNTTWNESLPWMPLNDFNRIKDINIVPCIFTTLSPIRMMSIPRSVNSFTATSLLKAASKYVINISGTIKVISMLDEGSIPAIITNSGGTIINLAATILMASNDDRLTLLKSFPSIWNCMNWYPFAEKSKEPPDCQFGYKLYLRWTDHWWRSNLCFNGCGFKHNLNAEAINFWKVNRQWRYQTRFSRVCPWTAMVNWFIQRCTSHVTRSDWQLFKMLSETPSTKHDK